MSFGWIAGFGVSGAIFNVFFQFYKSDALLQLLVPQILCFITAILVMSTYGIADQEFVVKREKAPFKLNGSTGLMLVVFSTFLVGFTLALSLLVYLSTFLPNSLTAVFVTGGLSMLIQAALANRFGIHVYLLKISYVFAVVGSILIAVLGREPFVWLVLISFGAFPIIPLILELAVEASWPADEGSVAGTFWTVAFVSSVLIGALSIFVSPITLIVAASISFLCCLFVRVDVFQRRQEVAQ